MDLEEKTRNIKKEYSKQPMRVSFEVTRNCNLNCIFCSVENELREPELTKEDFFSLIDELDDIGIKVLLISGGEPFVSKDTLDIIKYASKKEGIKKIHLASNGTLITPETALLLKENRITASHVSIDSSKKEMHDWFRGRKGIFEDAMKGVTNLIKAGIAEVGIHTVVTNFNYKEIPEVLQLIHSYGGNVYSLERFLPVGKGKARDKELAPSSEEYCFALESLYKVKKAYENNNMYITLGDPLKALVDKEYYNYYSQFNGSGVCFGCLAGVTDLTIDASGNAKYCFHSHYKVGNVMESSFLNVWKHELLQKLRDRNNLKGSCGTCKNRWICGGCREHANLVHGDPLGEDPLCWLGGRDREGKA